jgi:hypothetical protein
LGGDDAKVGQKGGKILVGHEALRVRWEAEDQVVGEAEVRWEVQGQVGGSLLTG